MLPQLAPRIVIVFIAVVAVTACGGSQQAGSASSPTSLSSPQAPALLTPEQVVAKLQAGGMLVGQITVFTASTDPNKVLGRPHQYSGKTTWVDTSLPVPSDPTDISAGGSIEAFASVGDLTTRSQYVANIAKTPLFAEYDYISPAGLVFMRLSGTLVPEQALRYVAAAKKFLPDLVAVSV
jgi:hypothetical protein